MSDEPERPTPFDDELARRRRQHLRLLPEAATSIGVVPAPRARSIGRLIAQTALIAESALTRREFDPALGGPRTAAGRFLGRFR
jgi:hypothetical protein